MYYIIIFVLLLLAELFYFRVADKFNIIDKPNERSSHTRVTLRGGGIIFYFGVLFYFLTSQFEYPWFFTGLTLISFISFMADIRYISQKIRLAFHFAAVGLMLCEWGILGMPWYWLIPILIVCAGIINAYNFMDGINGITGGYSLIILLALAYFNHSMVTFVDANLIYIVTLAVLVFSFFNFRENTRLFTGDVGALSIAFILLFLIGRLIIATHDLSFIILLIVYGVDSVLTIIHRIILRENIGIPHRKHLYQLLANELKCPHIYVSLLYMFVQALIIIGYILLYPQGYGYWYLLGSILLLSIVYVCFMKKYFHLHQRK